MTTLLNELTPAEWRLVVSLVEAIATSDEEWPICHRQVDRSNLAEHMAACREFSTVRTRRLEVVDHDGRTVLVVGELDRRRVRAQAFVIAGADPVTDPEGAKRFREAPPPTHEVLWGTVGYRVFVPSGAPDDTVAAARPCGRRWATVG